MQLKHHVQGVQQRQVNARTCTIACMGWVGDMVKLRLNVDVPVLLNGSLPCPHRKPLLHKRPNVQAIGQTRIDAHNSNPPSLPMGNARKDVRKVCNRFSIDFMDIAYAYST